MKITLLILALSLSIVAIAQDIGNLPFLSSGNVTLPLDEYNRLMELANKPETKPENAPVTYAIKRADLKLKVTSDSVLGTVQCDGEIFKKGINKIPLMNTPAVLSARQSNKALPLMQENGMHTAILSGPGEFSITLDAGIPLNIETGRASFNLPAPAAGSVQLSLELPGEHANVKINPGLITHRTTENNKTIIEATLVPDQIANIWWTTREIAAPAAPREVRFLSDIKTLVSMSEADMHLAALANITVIQGEIDQFEVEIPAGFEMTGVTGATLESEETKDGRLILKTNGTEKKYHQFLISLEKQIGATKAAVPFLSFKGTQRETGEILIEGAGALELTATEGGTLKRMDLKEVNSYLRSLARHPLHAAFRYHRQPSEPPSLALEWKRFPDSSVLAAGAELAEITTLITSEGRSLTEVKLFVRNQAQPFLKVGLPADASIVTAEVAGQTVKPVKGSDGTRVPLLRTGFRPSGLYQISFVIMNAGVPFSQNGDSELILPKMDIPISLMKWEIFLPERYKVKNFEGDAMALARLSVVGSQTASFSGTWKIDTNRSDEKPIVTEKARSGGGPSKAGSIASLLGGVGGIAAQSLQSNRYGYGGGMMGGGYGSGLGGGMMGGGLGGYGGGLNSLINQGTRNAAGATSGEGMGEYGAGDGKGSVPAAPKEDARYAGKEIIAPSKGTTGNAPAASTEASTNVVNLQRRMAGVLPIRIDVPRAGASYNFIRPLIVDEETKLTFRYKSK
jgi:hypothetical protein